MFLFTSEIFAENHMDTGLGYNLLYKINDMVIVRHVNCKTIVIFDIYNIHIHYTYYIHRNYPKFTLSNQMVQ